VTGPLETHLRARRDASHKLLVTYITGGYQGWDDAVRAAVDAGADAVEIGIPFSDPVMDGPVIQRASQASLEAGTTPASVLQEARSLDVGVPLAVMTYYNLAYHEGHKRFAENLLAAGVVAAILPDLPLAESGPWREAASEAGVESVMLAAPTTPDHRLPELCEASQGFVYSVGLLGVTGERDSLAATATALAGRCKQVTDKPVLIGVGIGSPEQAVQACEVADGVVIGSAVVRQMVDGHGAEGVGELVAGYRAALDAG
jgi:tryptophan synthase alpha chain